MLPKGHCKLSDPGIHHTAVREVCEETGLSETEFSGDEYLGNYAYDETAHSVGATKVVHLFLFRMMQEGLPKIHAPDHVEGSWWPIDSKFPEMLYAYQQSYLHEVVGQELTS